MSAHFSSYHFWGENRAAVNKGNKKREKQFKGQQRIKILYGTTQEMLSESMAGFGAAGHVERAETGKIIWIIESSDFGNFCCCFFQLKPFSEFLFEHYGQSHIAWHESL